MKKCPFINIVSFSSISRQIKIHENDLDLLVTETEHFAHKCRIYVQ